MGRRENPISQCSRSLKALVTWLRRGRDRAGLTYQQLAARTDYSADTLARAASGRSVPQNLGVVTAYAKGCDLSVKEAERLWKQARRDEARAQGVLSGRRGGVHIRVVKDFADLHSAIVDLYVDDGSPALRDLEARAGGVGRLPRSTVSRVLNGHSTPSRTFVAAFAAACEVRRADLPEWTKAWDRADADRRSTRARSRQPGGRSVQQRLTTHDPLTPRDLQLLMSELEASARHEPGLKLLLHFPEPDEDPEAQASARMTRELLVDQAQRRGELACPGCHRPSFGYDGAHGWTPQLCADCVTQPPDRPGPPRPQPPPEVFQPPGPPDPAGHAEERPSTDTPTLSLLRKPPPLPRRVRRHWPDPAGPAPAPSQTADLLPTVSDQQNDPPASPPGPRAETRLTTRIRLNIPGSRPLPPVIIRRRPDPPSEGS
ncbi:helix-turn-helix transcriptional regulator [Streptomyces sp. NPDC091377]|uniref:helix-turn-helix transcriptional regulator n=1 Tax=unclassified Streptomyces TaxID=2593676 RepID=UPI003826EB7F